MGDSIPTDKVAYVIAGLKTDHNYRIKMAVVNEIGSSNVTKPSQSVTTLKTGKDKILTSINQP